MALTEVTEARSQPRVLWPHLVFATVLSVLVPFLGSAYLGLPARDVVHDWQRRAVALSMIMFAVILLPRFWNFELPILVFGAGFWVLFGAVSSTSFWRVAWRDPASIRIVRGGWGASLTVLNIGMFSWLAVLQMDLPTLTFIGAPNDTPVVKIGDALYGFEYDARRIHVQRGQLVLASIGSEPALVRIIAVPGDIFVPEAFAINVNGTSITRRTLNTQMHIEWALKDIVETLNAPDKGSDIAEISKGSAKLSGTSDAEPQILLRDTFIVARDEDLIDPRLTVLPITTIQRGDIASVPWAKFWSLGDHPGSRSDLVQPRVVFVD